MHDRAAELLKRREGFIFDVETTLRKDDFRSIFGVALVWVGSLQVIDALHLDAFAVKGDTTTAELGAMKVELSKGGLLFHHHGRPPALIHLFELSLLLANFFLMSQLHLVVPFKLFLCVSSLQI